MDAHTKHLDDEPAKDAPFYRALLGRDCCGQCVAAGAEQHARKHDEVVAASLRHAARLRAKADAARSAMTAPAGPGLPGAACPDRAQ